MIRVFLVLAILILNNILLSREAHAEDYEYAVKGTLPKIQLNASNEIEVVFSDKRIAKIVYSENKNKVLENKLVFENFDCESKYKRPDCRMTSWLSVYFIKLLWVDHPEMNKINKIVEIPKNLNSEPILYLDWTMKFWKNVSQNVPLFWNDLRTASATTIQCDSWAWIPEKISSFESISYETFALNKETEILYKKPVLELRQVSFTKGAKALTLNSIKPFRFSDISNSRALTAHTTSETMILSIKKNNKLCSYQIGRDTSRSTVFQKVQNDMSSFTALKFSDLNQGAIQLTQALQSELKKIDPKYELARKWLPPTIQILEAFGMARLEFSTLDNGRVRINVTILGAT